MSTTIDLPQNPATQMPAMPAPVKEHAWLEKFVGQWRSEAEISCQPDQPPMNCVGSESARMLGGFWLIAQGQNDSGQMPFSSVLTLGYDPKKARYIGTWVDSMTSHLWQYEGEVNAAGTILTLHAEAACPNNPGTLSKFMEVTEFKSPDHRLFTSSIQGADGTWRTVVKVNYHRTK